MGVVERHDGLAIPGRVVLAHEPPFILGRLHINPPLREVRNGDRRQIIEPRVMQVLVALARAGGEIITRDELIESCWNGRIVGDDSINRALSRIRKIASGIGEGCFAVETIARVGYRLTRRSATAAPAPVPREPAVQRGFDRRTMIGGAAAVAGLGAIGIGALGLRPDPVARGEPLPEARALYERAITLRQNGGPFENRQALAYLREAVRLSPTYGQAWGSLALAYRYAMGQEPPERVTGFDERLREAVRNAELYAPGNPDAAIAKLPLGGPFGRWRESEATYRSMIRRNPKHGGAYMLLGNLLMEVGRWSEAARALEAAKARNPSTAVLRYRLAVSLWSAGQVSRAEDEIEEAMRLWPQQGSIWQTKIKLLALTGRPREALALTADPGSTPLSEEHAPDPEGRKLYLTALASRASADVERSIRWALNRAREIEAERVNVALQAASLGRVPLALDLLEGVYLNEGDWRLRTFKREWLSTHPLFQPHARPMWTQPRFKRIVEKTGLEAYWRATGTVPDYRRTA